MFRKTVQNKASNIKYTRLWNICLPMKKLLEEIMEADRNWQIGF